MTLFLLFLLSIPQIPDWRDAIIVAKNPEAAKRATSFAERLRLGFAVIHGEQKESESDKVDGRHSPPPQSARTYPGGTLEMLPCKWKKNDIFFVCDYRYVFNDDVPFASIFHLELVKCVISMRLARAGKSGEMGNLLPWKSCNLEGNFAFWREICAILRDKWSFWDRNA